MVESGGFFLGWLVGWWMVGGGYDVDGGWMDGWLVGGFDVDDVGGWMIGGHDNDDCL